MFIKLHIDNIAYSVRLEDLESFCETLQLVAAIDMPLDRHTGRSRGFVFVTFASSDAARVGLAEVTGRELGGQMIRAQLVAQEPPR